MWETNGTLWLSPLPVTFGQRDAEPQQPLGCRHHLQFPATGKVFGPRLIAALGTDRNRFSSAQELENYSGIAPVTCFPRM
ncbi:MAG: hypothetical protein KAH99_02800 [Verrucomicrobia bacterium]|nr:hypothetical protein [Verrucomicrobiota bacterium]